MNAGIRSFAEMHSALAVSPPDRQLKIISLEDHRLKGAIQDPSSSLFLESGCWILRERGSS
jgi:hypothetical protein